MVQESILSSTYAMLAELTQDVQTPRRKERLFKLPSRHRHSAAGPCTAPSSHQDATGQHCAADRTPTLSCQKSLRGTGASTSIEEENMPRLLCVWTPHRKGWAH